MLRKMLLLALPALCLAQPLTFHSSVDDSAQPYALHLPNPLDPARKYPLLIGLHSSLSGYEAEMRRLLAQTRGQTGRSPIGNAPSVPGFADFIVAFPQARGTLGYQGIAGTEIYELLAELERRYPVDPDRVYLTGADEGGGGTMWLALTRPDVWAAVAPLAPEVPPGAEDLAGNALNLPVHLFHGDQDPLIPVDVSRAWQKRFLDLGVKADYSEYPGVRHNVLDFASRNGALFAWFAGIRRNSCPGRVRFATRAYKYASAYWVRLDALTPGTLASLDASFTGPNALKIATSNLDGFTLTLEGHPSYSARAALRVTIDGAALRLKPAAVLSFHKAAGAWRAGLRPGPHDAKHAGSEGPIAEAVAARHIYVYGTADSPSPEEQERRIGQVRLAAAWPKPLAFAVKADSEITPDDVESANLVLFGTRETNSLLARLAPRLPMALNAGAADWGLLFIAPMGARYVLVSSGLPWWTGARRGSEPFHLLSRFEDYVVFKGSIDKVVAQGFFDRAWKLPPEAAAAIRAAGTVTIR